MKVTCHALNIDGRGERRRMMEREAAAWTWLDRSTIFCCFSFFLILILMMVQNVFLKAEHFSTQVYIRFDFSSFR